MFGEVCSNFTYNFHWDNETFVFDHELECTVSRTVFVLFSFIGIAGLVGNALVVLGKVGCGDCVVTVITSKGLLYFNVICYPSFATFSVFFFDSIKIIPSRADEKFILTSMTTVKFEPWILKIPFNIVFIIIINLIHEYRVNSMLKLHYTNLITTQHIIDCFIFFPSPQFRLVVAANPMMRSTTNILIINLAVADLLFVIFCKNYHMQYGNHSFLMSTKRLRINISKHLREKAFACGKRSQLKHAHSAAMFNIANARFPTFIINTYRLINISGVPFTGFDYVLASWYDKIRPLILKILYQLYPF